MKENCVILKFEICFDRYKEAEQFLCKRILAMPGRDWNEEVASSHSVSHQ
jgi:hypothetical protein